jgi:hypothetical protein
MQTFLWPLAKFPLDFVPHFKGGLIKPDPFGVEVDTGSGVVTLG